MTTSVYIAKTVYGGDGLGRLSDGRVVFVPGAFAGEHVKAEIVQEKRSFVRARLVAVEDASKDRVGTEPAPVPGMVYSNLSVVGENAAKAQQLADFLERARIPVAGGVVREPVAGGRPEDSLGYRNKAVYRFSLKGGKLAFGYLREPGHEIADLERDPLARPEINAALPDVRRNVFSLLTQGSPSVRRSVEGMETATVRWTRRSGVRWWIGDAPGGLVLREEAGGRPFDVPADGFWQVNPAVGEALAASVAREAASSPADEIVDLYCGVGVLGISAALASRRSPRPRVFGVETGRRAVECAAANARAAGVDAKFVSAQAGRAVRRIRAGAGTVVIVDPPRSGMERQAAEWLAASGAGRIVMASCDPATLVRDLKTLSRSYSVASVRWFNMFPRTARFETLAVLERRRG